MKALRKKVNLVIAAAVLAALAWRFNTGQQYDGSKPLFARQRDDQGRHSKNQSDDPGRKHINKGDNGLTERTVDSRKRLVEQHNKSDTRSTAKIAKAGNDSAQLNSQRRLAERTGPYVYPEGGTGITVDIGEEYNASVINVFCESNDGLTAVIPIYSAPDFFKMRNILRSTLGNYARTLNCKILFIVGVSLNQSVNTLLREEYNRDKDILMMAKIDSYRDLNDKAVVMIEWISQHCTNVPYAIHMIDDAYVNLDMFLKRLNTIHEEYYMIGGDQGIYRVQRNRRKFKNFLTMEEYPEKFFPHHLVGFAYAFPTRVAGRLLSAVHTAQYCYIEDVWLTGHVRQEAKVELKGLVFGKDWIAEKHLAKTPKLYNNLTSFYIAHSIKAERFASLYSINSN